MNVTWEKNRIKYRNEPGIMPYLWCLQEEGEDEELVCILYGVTTYLYAPYELRGVPLKKLVSRQDQIHTELVEKYTKTYYGFPAITVIERFDKYHVIEGNHRANALIRSGHKMINAKVYKYRDVKRIYKMLRKARKEEQKWDEDEIELKIPAVDLSQYDSVFDAVADQKGNWEVEHYYHPLPEEEKDEQKEGEN